MLVPGRSLAWDRHDLIRYEALRDLRWLESLPPVIVTTRSETLEGLAGSYEFPFLGEKPGDEIEPRTVLVRYADEPDRGLDDGLTVSWLERYVVPLETTTSRRLLHSWVPFWSVHLPLSHIDFGAGPGRGQLFYRAMRRAFDRDELYWGLRYLASLLHYVEDAGQPFHASRTSTAFMFHGLDDDGVVRVMANYHLVYQRWVTRRLLGAQLGLQQKLRGHAALDLDGVEEGVSRVAARSRRLGQPLFDACVGHFGDRFKAPVAVEPRWTDLADRPGAASERQLAGATEQALEWTARAVRGMLASVRPYLREALVEHPPGEAPAAAYPREWERALEANPN